MTKRQLRHHDTKKPDGENLGPLSQLPGEWRGVCQGWNMIALPFAGAPPPKGFNYRLLMNQYDETLKFTLVDSMVPNRGLPAAPGADFDQFVVTLDYQQVIHQVAAADFPPSDLAGKGGLAIHHEPGLWLHMINLRTQELDIARLATIPHGNSVLALGKSHVIHCAPEIPVLHGLPIGRLGQDVERDDYLLPYKHFINDPFRGIQPPDFLGFSPLDMNALLRLANVGVEIEKTTVLTVVSTNENAGVVNIPFVTKQAEPVSLKSTFWIQQLKARDKYGNPKLRLQYSQVVMLDFFRPRQDELPGRAQWPHVSINTLEKVSE